MPVLRTALIAFLTLLLSGCYFLGGNSPKTRFYALEVAPDLVVRSDAVSARFGIGPVRIPDSLQRPQLVTRNDAYERSYADFDHWAGSLEANLLRVIGSGLMQQLPAAQVQLHPWSHTRAIDYQIRIDIVAMDGSLGESAALEGTLTWWDVKTREEITQERFALETTPGNGSHQALVAAWSALVNQVAAQIADRALTLGSAPAAP